jgi:two-component system chemotaxis response regulator CheY
VSDDGRKLGDGGVLVVDDDADIRETILSILSRHGFAAEIAADGQEALERLRTDPQLPGLILLDLMMPRMNGEEFRAAQLADPRLAGVPVVVLSGARGVDDLARRIGVEVLPKPFELSTLLQVVKRFCVPRKPAGKN